MRFGMTEVRRLCLAGLVLAASQAMHAGDTRVFNNTSDTTWVLNLFAVKGAPVNTWTIKVGETVTKLDSANNVEIPPNTRCEVQFKVPDHGLLQMFELRAKNGVLNGSFGNFTANYSSISFFAKRSPVTLAVTSSSAPAKANDVSQRADIFLVNKPLIGDLTMLSPAPDAASKRKAGFRPYEIKNNTDLGWTLTLGDGAANGKVALEPDTKVSKTTTFAQVVLAPNTTTKIRFTGDDNGLFNQVIRLECKNASEPGPYALKVVNVPKGAWPEDISITDVNAAKNKNSWIFTKRFAMDGFIEIQDPASLMLDAEPDGQ
jgi:hypothetical protein